MDLITILIQSLANDILYMPLELLLVWFLLKFLFHQDINAMLFGHKDRRGMYVKVDNYTNDGKSTGNIELSIEELVASGQVFALQQENIALKKEIEILKDKNVVV